MRLKEWEGEYRRWAANWLKEHLNGTATLSDIETGVDAWEVAHRSGIAKHAYGLSRDVLDAHIQTVLQRIMPNAVFKDPKRY